MSLIIQTTINPCFLARVFVFPRTKNCFVSALAKRAEIVACAATLRARGAKPMVSPLLSITPLPSGRAARVKVSDAFRLPPNCHCGRQGIGCHPRGVRRTPRARTAPGRSVAFTETVSINLTSPAPPPSRSGAKLITATLSQIKFFHRMWIKFVCGRGHPRTSPGGGDPQEGARPPLARPRRVGAPSPPPAGGETLPVRHGHFPSAFLRRTPPGAQCAPLRHQRT